MSQPATALSDGTVIGERYRVRQLLGEGGMGAVYEAENTLTGRRVALKVLSARHTTQDVRKRLLREARVAARVQHPHVIDIYDVGFDGDEMFLVMELLRGQPLDEWIAERAPVEPQEILGHAQQLLRGLGALHAAGVTHRDLKPANIFIVESEHEAPRAKLLDLGIARDRGTDSDTYTKPNQIIGTPAYMAPEQLERPDTLDQRADLHALGVVLYEALAGRRPYVADDLTTLAVAILAGKRTPLADVRPELPSGLCEAIERAMSHDPDDRFEDAASFAEALAPYGPEGAYVSLRPAAATRARSWWLPAVLVTIALVVGLVAFTLRPSAPEEGPLAAPPEPSATRREPSPVIPPEVAEPPTEVAESPSEIDEPPPQIDEELPAGVDPPPAGRARRRGARPSPTPREGAAPERPPSDPEPRPNAPHLSLDPDDF